MKQPKLPRKLKKQLRNVERKEPHFSLSPITVNESRSFVSVSFFMPTGFYKKQGIRRTKYLTRLLRVIRRGERRVLQERIKNGNIND
jgi:hypothetical protein